MEGRNTRRQDHGSCALAHGGFSDLVELKRADESTTVLRIVWRMLPRNGGRSSSFARTVTRRAVTSTVGNGIAFRDGRTESGASVGDAAYAPGCVTLPKAVICAEAGEVRWPPYFALTETCPAQSPGFLTSLRLSNTLA